MSQYVDKLSLRNPIHFLAVGFGSGLLRPAPGTWGSLVGILLGAALLHWLPHWLFGLLTALLFWAGCSICQKTADDMGIHDHGAIVWDEIVSVFFVLWALPEISWFWCAAAFVLFRVFDILKPYPVRYFDQKLKSGFGIMFDDLLAAGYSILVICLLRLF